MNTFNSFVGFGASVTDQLTTVMVTPTIPKPVAPAAVPTPDNGTHKWYDIVTGTVNSISNLANSASNAITTVKGSSGGSSSPGYVNIPNQPTAPPAPAKSNTMTYVLIGGSVLAIGITALVLMKKKNKS